MVGVFFSVVGSALGLLAATGATTAAGGETWGAVYTGIYMAVLMLLSAVSVPYAPRACRRFGVRRAFGLLRTVMAVAWLVAGVALLAGAPTMVVLLIAAPVFGVTAGLTVVPLPILDKSYLSAAPDTSRAYAVMAVVGGVAWGIGSLVGGVLLVFVPLGWGLVINGLLSAALIVPIFLVPPAAEPATPREQGNPWRAAWTLLATDALLRRATVVAGAAMLFLAPIASLVVPIAQDLRQTPLVSGAAALMLAFSVGRLFSPGVVKRLTRRWPDLPAASVAAIGAGAALAVLGLVSVFVTGKAELVIWLVIGLAFSAARYAGKALVVGSAADSGAPEDSSARLASLMLFSGLVGPVGILLWSVLIGLASAEAAVLVGGLGAALVSVVLFASSRRLVPAAEGP